MLLSLLLAAASPLEGVWTNPSRNVTVRIGPCGATLCGRVTSASAAARQEAASAGTPQLVGTRLMSDIAQTGPASWTADIFVPDRNVRAAGEIQLVGPREMSVSGCALGGLVCKSQAWTASPRQRVSPGRAAAEHRSAVWRLPRLLLSDPRVDFLLQDRQRKRAGHQHLGVEVADVELVAELVHRMLAQPLDGQRADLVSQRL